MAVSYSYLHMSRFCLGWRHSHHQNIISHLKSCSNIKGMKQIHAQMIRTRLIEDTFLASRVLAFLTVPSSDAENMVYARSVFDAICHPNSFIWNSMIRGYVQNHSPGQALLLYKDMLHCGFPPDGHTNPIIIRACAIMNLIPTGRTIHGLVVKHGFESDMFVMSGFVSLYAACGRVEIARKVFEEMPDRDLVAWTSMISGYAQSSHCSEAFNMFEVMRAAGVEPNKVTITSLAMACGQMRDLGRGIWLHSHILEHGMECDVMIGNSLISMYAKSGSMSRAVEVFDNMQVKNVVSWNALIGGFVKSGQYVEALSRFEEMLNSNSKPNETTFVSALTACAQLGDLKQGKLLHTLIDERSIICDAFIGNALVNMYAKCGDFKSAAHIFREISERDVITWTAMISGYVQENHFKEALALFKEMRISGEEPNEVTLVSLLSACSHLGGLNQGRQIHSYIAANGVRKDVHLGNALVDMYSKCGCIQTASSVFQTMPHRDTFSWNVMIGALATHGRGNEAIDLFNDMKRAGEVKPDHVTFLAVLSACAHSGLVQEGYYYFSSMSSLYGIVPVLEHYGCIVDLLTRAGLLDEANEFITRMPMEPNDVIWGALLAACSVHGRVDLAEKAARNIGKMATDDEGAHVLVSNVYAEAGRWDDVGRVRAYMSGVGIKKFPGCSSVISSLSIKYK